MKNMTTNNGRSLGTLNWDHVILPESKHVSNPDGRIEVLCFTANASSTLPFYWTVA